MLVPEELARQNIELFVEKYPFPRPGWIVSSRIGHYTVRVRELQSRTLCRRFDVTVSHRSGAVSVLYERLGTDVVQILKPQRMEWLTAYMQRMRYPDVSRIGYRF